ncbi:MAG: ABC transporter ATP-binding protein [Lachnospiraceae bacterium]|nr:ABC transporter ATP-binding protein [Lachnospiraceae bacterium]
MSDTVVEIDHLVKRYKELIALDNFSLRIEKGEAFGLLGPNGSGKTTTINCLLSLLAYDNGEIKIFGERMTPNRLDIKKRIGVVSQNVAVFNELNVYENTDYFCGLYIKEKEKRKQYVEEALEFVGLLEFKKFYPKKLSGGLLRRLNIACGIAHKPELIIFDEPTVAVDPQSRNNILEGIAKLNENGATIIYTSHYMEEVERLCSKILIMDRGKRVAEGTSDELKSLLKNTENVIVTIRKLSEQSMEEIRALPHVYDVKYMNETLTIKCSGGKHNITHVAGYFSEHQMDYERIYSELPTLNDVFLEITGKELRDKE